MEVQKSKEDLTDPEKAILIILEDLGEASTAEVVEEVADLPNNCKDRAPSILMALEKYNLISKKISREKKAIVWYVKA